MQTQSTLQIQDQRLLQENTTNSTIQTASNKTVQNKPQNPIIDGANANANFGWKLVERINKIWCCKSERKSPALPEPDAYATLVYDVAKGDQSKANCAMLNVEGCAQVVSNGVGMFSAATTAAGAGIGEVEEVVGTQTGIHQAVQDGVGFVENQNRADSSTVRSVLNTVGSFFGI